MYKGRRSYRELFDEAYGAKTAFKSLAESGSVLKASVPGGIGHPDYEYLTVGEIEQGTVVAFFMDIRGFTKLAIALDDVEVVRILQATMAASIFSIFQYGGYVTDLTGDGIMALFGGRDSTDSEDAVNAVTAAAFMMKGMKEVVADHLAQLGYETVRVGMGLEYGNVLWCRLGLPGTSQVKPISGISFLAGKLCTSKYTGSWECKIGQNLAQWVPDTYKSKTARYDFQYEGQTFSHDLYLFDWEAYHSDYELEPLRMEYLGKSRSLPTPAWPSALAWSRTNNATEKNNERSGPRMLKDQPFFS